MELLQEMELEKEVICGKVQEKFHISSQEAAQEVENIGSRVNGRLGIST